MRHFRTKLALMVLAQSVILACTVSAQFRDDFNGPLKKDPDGVKGWAFVTGEGKAVMDLKPGDGCASIVVDATRDRRNVWWALIMHRVSDPLDLSLLKDPAFALRVEARIRASEAPRRVNLHLNTQKTVDFHTHLMEYDIPDTTNWHTISMTTHGFQAAPGDTVNAQLALMDWGLGEYRVDIDYFKVDVVNAAEAGPDLGDPVPYHPPVPDPKSFGQAVPPIEEGMVDLLNPDVNFSSWSARARGKTTDLLTVSGTQYVVLRWDLAAFAGKKLSGPGLLEMTTRSLERIADGLPDFGQVRVCEIVGGDPCWERKTVTFNSLCGGHKPDQVILPQMIIDWPVTEGDGGKTCFVISKPALQRLVDSKTLGIALRPLGAINASFYSRIAEGGKFAIRLLFNLAKLGSDQDKHNKIN